MTSAFAAYSVAAFWPAASCDTAVLMYLTIVRPDNAQSIDAAAL